MIDANFSTAIKNLNRRLLSYFQTRLTQFHDQGIFIHFLKKTIAKRVVNLIKRFDYLVCQIRITHLQHPFLVG